MRTGALIVIACCAFVATTLLFTIADILRDIRVEMALTRCHQMASAGVLCPEAKR